MATVQAGFTYCSTQMNSVDVGAGTSAQLAAVTASPVMVVSTTLDTLFNFMERAFDDSNTPWAVRAQDRPTRPDWRFSLEELYETLDNAAREVALRVRAEFLKPLWSTINPASNVFDQSDKIRLLGSRTKIGTVIANRLGIYQYRDITSRGVTFSDSAPVYTAAGGELLVHGDTPATPNPTDAEATYIKLPEVTTFSATGTRTSGSTTQYIITITGGDDELDSTRDLYTMIRVVDGGGDTHWAMLRTIPTTTSATVQFIQQPPTGLDTTGLTFTWWVPAFYEMPRILEKLVVQLAAGDLFMAMGETTMANEAYTQYGDALKEFALPQYVLPIESERNE